MTDLDYYIPRLSLLQNTLTIQGRAEDAEICADAIAEIGRLRRCIRSPDAAPPSDHHIDDLRDEIRWLREQVKTPTKMGPVTVGPHFMRSELL
jgi:hypothetical protein